MKILPPFRVNRTLFIFCILIFASVPALGRDNIAPINNEHDDEIMQLISKLEGTLLEDGYTLEARREAIISLHRFGKDAIPFLIDNISNGKETSDLLVNPRNSDIRLALKAKTYAGTLSSFLIELILNRDQLKPIVNDDKGFLLGSYENYPIWEGVIKKKNGLALKADLPRIKTLYQAWWEKNKSESIEKLREMQKSGNSVLNRKPYYWA